jgi:hypothetical protein
VPGPMLREGAAVDSDDGLLLQVPRQQAHGDWASTSAALQMQHYLSHDRITCGSSTGLKAAHLGGTPASHYKLLDCI